MGKKAVIGFFLLLVSASTFSTVLAQDGLKAPTLSKTLAGARLANVPEVRKRLGLVPGYENVAGIEAVKIAVLDYGFDGIGSNRRYLPENAVVVEHYDPAFVRKFNLGDPDLTRPFAPLNSHGRNMAQIVWGVTGFNPNGPQFFLLNANGPTMLRRAVRFAMEARVDIILFSGVFEGGGYGDGRGFINRLVADALAADILWINAAGNYGGHVYNGPIRVQPDGYLQFANAKDSTCLRFRNLLDENTITITLIWNDYREAEDAGTMKDLDLFVQDAEGKVIGSSEKVQVPASGKAGPEMSLNPRERVVLADLPAQPDSDYRIRIRARSKNFTATDQLRVLITSGREGVSDPRTNKPEDGVRFLDASGKGEIFPPADNPLVLTVGDGGGGSSVGPTADHRVKPDVVIEDSRAYFTTGEMTAGASNAAAYFAGIVAVLKAAEPDLRTRHLLWFAHYGRAIRLAAGSRPSSVLPSRPTVVPAAGSDRVRRIWQTPTREELTQQVRKKGL